MIPVAIVGHVGIEIAVQIEIAQDDTQTLAILAQAVRVRAVTKTSVTIAEVQRVP